MTVGLACVALALFAAWPTIHFAGRTLLDLRMDRSHWSLVGNVLRGTGRFVWSLTWLVALGVAPSSSPLAGLPARLSRARRRDCRPARRWPAVQVPRSGGADYQQVAGLLLDEKSRAQPASRCSRHGSSTPASRSEIPFDDLAPVLLAAAVWELPINSGYPGRPAPDFGPEICSEQANKFAAGQLRAGRAVRRESGQPGGRAAGMPAAACIVLLACRCIVRSQGG